MAALPAYRDLLREGESVLGAAGVSTPRLDAEVLLASAAGVDRTGLIARLSDAVAGDASERFRALLERRRRREPVAYLTGVREFWSLPIEVSPAVLIPRPETELLVEVARELLGDAAALVCDAGTGSGCIAVALARELGRARVIAIDASPAALAVARRNARRLGVADRIAFACADWLDGLGGDVRFDAIVSNPPYLAPGDFRDAELDWEPRGALAAGSDGLDAMRRLFGQASRHLRSGGWIAVELGLGQAPAVRDLAAAAGFGAIELRSDLAGIPRVLIARGPERD